MVQFLVTDLLDQYQRTFQMIREEIERFDQTQWIKGIDFFQSPVKVAMHIVDCLDFYFRQDTQVEYRWGHRFGGGWWELADEKLPGPTALLAYCAEIEARIMAQLTALDDTALSQSSPDDDAATLLGHYIYALRHTLHHHGELATLSTYHGNPGGSWA